MDILHTENYEVSNNSYNFEHVPDLECPDNYTTGEYHTSLLQTQHADDGFVRCNTTYDSVICWPPTLAGELSAVPCPLKYKDVFLNTEGFATKFCFENGTWQMRANYSQCLEFDEHHEEDIHQAVRVIFYVGYTISTVALLLALFLFTYFRSLWCVRNTIHSHLMATFVIKNLLWIVMHNTLPLLTNNIEEQRFDATSAWTCQLIVACFNYIQSASFFWMQVEGVYLHTMIVWAYSADKVRLWKYALFGWGGPFVTVFAWAVVKTTIDNDSCCCWLPRQNSYWDYIYITPVLIILLVNLIFLASIEYVLITKLKASNSLVTRQYKKAVKGTVILFPLLGVIYVLVITQPGTGPLAKKIFIYFNAISQSVQGLFVAVFYCFLNGEVRKILGSRMGRWKDQRTIGSTYSRHSRASIHRGDLPSSLYTNTAVNRELLATAEKDGKGYLLCDELNGSYNPFKDLETGEIQSEDSKKSVNRDSELKCNTNGENTTCCVVSALGYGSD